MPTQSRSTVDNKPLQYARFADDMVIVIDSHPRNDWLMRAVDKRFKHESREMPAENVSAGRAKA